MADWELKGNVALLVLDMQKGIVGEGGKDEPVVRKQNTGIFSHSNLDDVLKYYGAETLVLVGVTTNLVVHIGAAQATDQGYSVIVSKDAVTSVIKRFLLFGSPFVY